MKPATGSVGCFLHCWELCAEPCNLRAGWGSLINGNSFDSYLILSAFISQFLIWTVLRNGTGRQALIWTWVYNHCLDDEIVSMWFAKNALSWIFPPSILSCQINLYTNSGIFGLLKSFKIICIRFKILSAALRTIFHVKDCFIICTVLQPLIICYVSKLKIFSHQPIGNTTASVILICLVLHWDNHLDYLLIVADL